MLRTVFATRYVTPLREGGSMPAIVEADDSGLYVLKFRGAGQGPLALTAELISGEIGRALGLKVPEIVLMEVDGALGRNEPDQEIRDLLTASTGLNLALDYLPGSLMFDPAARDKTSADIASTAVWFDAFTTNVDRTARNPNLLWWHKVLYFIDHGASLYFHHNWTALEKAALNPFTPIRDHVLLRWASRIAEIDAELRARFTEQFFVDLLEQVPDAWLPAAEMTDASTTHRATSHRATIRRAYVDYFLTRLDHASLFVEEAVSARARLV